MARLNLCMEGNITLLVIHVHYLWYNDRSSIKVYAWFKKILERFSISNNNFLSEKIFSITFWVSVLSHFSFMYITSIMWYLMFRDFGIQCDEVRARLRSQIIQWSTQHSCHDDRCKYEASIFSHARIVDLRA